MDLGASYNFLDFYAHCTVKNVLASQRKLYSDIESVNLKRLAFNFGYIFGDDERIMWEPSILFQSVVKPKKNLLTLI